MIDAENSERIQNEDPAERSQVDNSYPFDYYSKTLADLSSQLDTTLKEVTQRMQFYDKSLMVCKNCCYQSRYVNKLQKCKTVNENV